MDASLITDTTLLFANGLNGLGVAGLLIAHSLIAENKLKEGFFLSSIGALLVAIGSTLLFSWPVVFLNVVWFCFGLAGGLNPSMKPRPNWQPPSLFGFILAFIMGLFCLFAISTDLSAWIATGIYIAAFIMLTMGQMKSHQYLFICLLGYVLLVPHLYMHNSYAVLFNETLGALIGVIGIFGYFGKLQKQR